jgi:hypothetical protein
MLFPRRIALVTLSSFLISGSALGCRATSNTNYRISWPVPVIEKAQPKEGELKVLAEGLQSAIKNPFVALVRDADTYAALTKLDGKLPKLDDEFFKTKVVVAAFLGERNTGGYSVEISRDAAEINVREKKPGKDMMVTQMVTSPFKIVALEGMSNAPVWLALDDALESRMSLFHITNAKFTMSGGIAGTREEFNLGGAIGVLRAGNLATFQFRLIAPATTKRRALIEHATGVVANDNSIKVSRMSADSFIDPPNTGLQADGLFSDGGKKLLLNLLSRPSMIADGYSGVGSIEAEFTRFRSVRSEIFIAPATPEQYQLRQERNVHYISIRFRS